MNSFDEMKALFDFDVIKLLDEVFRQSDVQKTMIEFNQDQLQEGKDALGQVISTIGGNPYRPYTIIIKKAINNPKAPSDRVTLYQTGEFYKTFKVIINKDSYEIIADFEVHDGSILDNFSSKYDFLGLDDESLYELAYEIVLPRLGTLIRKRFGL